MAKERAERIADRELVSERFFDAPRARVFEAFRDPVRLARWWGPKGFRSTFQEFDLRAGGAWRLVMHGPNGVDYPNESVFVEVVEPERIVFRHVSSHPFEMTMTLSEQGNGTRLTWRMLHPTAAACARFRDVGLAANEENFDRLEAELATMA